MDLVEVSQQLVNAAALSDTAVRKIIDRHFPGIEIDKVTIRGRFKLYHAKASDIARSCPISKHQHRSNTVYFMYDPLCRSVIVKCFKCEGGVALENLETSLYTSLSVDMTQSEKRTRKCNSKTHESKFPKLEDIEIERYEHDTLSLSDDEIFTFYTTNHFSTVPAMKDAKRPKNKGWTEHEFCEDTVIDMASDNLAIVTGDKSGIFVVDVDINDNGLSSFQKLCSVNSYNYTKRTTCVRTPSGGIHLYYKYDDRIKCNSDRLRDTDSKSIGYSN